MVEASYLRLVTFWATCCRNMLSSLIQTVGSAMVAVGVALVVLGLGVGLRYRARLLRRVSEEKDKARSEFISAVAHDLITPLTVLTMCHEALREEALSAKQAELMDIQSISVEQLVLLVRRALDYRQLESGDDQLLPQLTAVDLHQLIHERCRRYVSGTHQDKEVKVVFHISTDTPATIMADPEILFQLVVTLMTNAIKATDRGSVELFLMVTESSELRVEVKDTGRGIHPKLQADLFKPFSRIRSLELEGMGLGLYLLKQRVASLKGECGMSSSGVPGEGCAFWFQIPFVAVAPDSVFSDQDAPATKTKPRLVTMEEFDDEDIDRTSIEVSGDEKDQEDEELMRQLTRASGKSLVDLEALLRPVEREEEGGGREEELRTRARSASFHSHGSKEKQALASAKRASEVSVLFVHGNSHLQKLVAIVFRGLKIRMEGTMEYTDALQRTKLRHYTMVLMNVDMPKAKNFLNEVRSWEKQLSEARRKHQYICGLTRDLHTDKLDLTRSQLMAQGLDALMSLPCSTTHFRAVLEHAQKLNRVSGHKSAPCMPLCDAPWHDSLRQPGQSSFNEKRQPKNDKLVVIPAVSRSASATQGVKVRTAEVLPMPKFDTPNMDTLKHDVPNHETSSELHPRSAAAAVLQMEQQADTRVRRRTFEGATSPSTEWTCLIVEDEPFILKITTQLVKRSGASRVDTAVNGEIGLAMLQAELYDMVLMDLNMPVMTGIDCVKAFSAWEAENAKPLRRKHRQFICALTANSTAEVKAVCLTAGMSTFLSKPCNAAKVKEARDQSIDFNERTRIYAASDPSPVTDYISVADVAEEDPAPSGAAQEVARELHVENETAAQVELNEDIVLHSATAFPAMTKHCSPAEATSVHEEGLASPRRRWRVSTTHTRPFSCDLSRANAVTLAEQRSTLFQPATVAQTDNRRWNLVRNKFKQSRRGAFVFDGAPVDAERLALTNVMEAEVRPPPVRTSTVTSACVPDAWHSCLLVEDDPLIRMLMINIFRTLECKSVHTAVNGKQGLEMMQENLYDVVFMDINMNVMNGIECVLKLRQWEAEKKAADREFRRARQYPQYVCAVTANSTKLHQDMCEQVGMNAFVSKPTKISDVKQQVIFAKEHRSRYLDPTYELTAEQQKISQRNTIT